VPRCPSPAASLASPSHSLTLAPRFASLRPDSPRLAPPVQFSTSETGDAFLTQMRQGILRRDSRLPRRVAQPLAQRLAHSIRVSLPPPSPLLLPHCLTFSPFFLLLASPPRQSISAHPSPLTPHRRLMPLPHPHASHSSRCRIKHLCISSSTIVNLSLDSLRGDRHIRKRTYDRTQPSIHRP
jgi:hypothetical protein